MILAIIGVAGTLAASLLAIVGGLVVVDRQNRSSIALQAAKDQREDEALWDQQLGEAVAATMNFLFSVNLVRAGWVDTSATRFNDGRKSAVEMHEILALSVAGLKAMISISMRRDGEQHIVDRAHELTACLDDLLNALGRGRGSFEEQLERANEALKAFRQAIDQRHQQ
jgi:hypothetical protein